jgi:hypothetical protein
MSSVRPVVAVEMGPEDDHLLAGPDPIGLIEAQRRRWKLPPPVGHGVIRCSFALPRVPRTARIAPDDELVPRPDRDGRYPGREGRRRQHPPVACHQVEARPVAPFAVPVRAAPDQDLLPVPDRTCRRTPAEWALRQTLPGPSEGVVEGTLGVTGPVVNRFPAPVEESPPGPHRNGARPGKRWRSQRGPAGTKPVPELGLAPGPTHGLAPRATARD